MKPKIFSTLPGYTARLFAADAFAGITVALVALPLSIAIAIASGADPKAGLVTAIIGGFVISALGGSRVQIGGPTGAFIVVVFNVITAHGFGGLLLATWMAGIILIAAGLAGAGRIIRLVPEPVIEGFTIGIAVIIALSQFKDLFGLHTAKTSADALELVPALWAARAGWNGFAAAVGIGTFVLILLLRRISIKIPGAIVAVVATSAIAFIWAWPVDDIAARFGVLPAGLPMPHLPEVTLAKLSELFPSALIIAFLAAIESLLSAIVADRMVGGSHRPNAELLAQGAANFLSPLFGGLPATGAIARTATNVRAGGRTPVAGMVHALTILVATWTLGPLIGQLAMPALAGLLIYTAWSMSEPNRWRERLQMRRADFWLLLLTAALTILTSLTVAIALGTVIGLGQRLLRRGVEEADWHEVDR